MNFKIEVFNQSVRITAFSGGITTEFVLNRAETKDLYKDVKKAMEFMELNDADENQRSMF